MTPAAAHNAGRLLASSGKPSLLAAFAKATPADAHDAGISMATSGKARKATPADAHDAGRLLAAFWKGDPC